MSTVLVYQKGSLGPEMKVVSFLFKIDSVEIKFDYSFILVFQNVII